MNISLQRTPAGHNISIPSSDESVHLSCGSCRMRYDASRRRPLSLQCFHSFCEHCISGMTVGKSGSKVTCGQCKKTTKLDKNQTSGNVLPVNYSILNMLSVNNRPVPVNVGLNRNPCDANSPSPVPFVRSSCDSVTVIPVNSNNKNCKENRQTPPPCDRANNCRYDDRMNCPIPAPSLSLNNASSAHAATICVTVTSSTNEASPCHQTQLQQTPCQSVIPPAGRPLMVPSLTPTVTSLTVKSLGSSSHPTTANSTCQPPVTIDLCCQCHINPATITVTNAAQMSSQKLCSACNGLVQNKPGEELEVPARNPVQLRRNKINQNCSSSSSDAPTTTVVKYLDENSTCAVATPPPLPPQNQCQALCVSKTCEQTPCLPIPTDEGCHRGSIHVDGIKGSSVIPKHPSKISVGQMGREDRVIVSDIPKDEGPQKLSAVKPTYQACSKFDLKTNETIKKPAKAKPVGTQCCANGNRNEKRSSCEPMNISNDLIDEDIYRPLPYNPDFPNGDDAHRPIPVLEPLQPEAPPIESPYTFLPTTSRPPASYNEKQPMPLDYQAVTAPSVPFHSSAPPKYEEVMGYGVPSMDAASQPSSLSIQLVNCFGKYGELATQPGAFRSPGRVNVSNNGIIVVSDAANKTVQAFNPNGECLALIRVTGDGINGCSCYDGSNLAVGTNSGVQVYNFNGLLKKSIPLGPVINTVSTRNLGFIAVQTKALHMFRGPDETHFRSLRDRSKPGSVRQPIPFDCIADAAVNSQMDVVVLDAGAASGLGTIFILSDEGYLKSSIVPGRESCGVLRQPTAVAVDANHNIIVSDSGNRRVLLFGANGRFQRQLLGPGQVGGQVGTDPMKVYPIGLDIADDGRLFVVARGEKYADIRVFTYQ